MAAIQRVEPVVRICAVISRYDHARDWGLQSLRDAWGPIAHQTDPMPFQAGGFYDAAMGTDLLKVLVAFDSLCDPVGLAEWKLTTNQWEIDYANQSQTEVPRPLNLDCGYVTQAKLVLATTKDRDHRIYLRDGIFAEVTINYVHKKWAHHRWSYPDYRTDEVAEFATRCRQQVRDAVKSSGELRKRTQRDHSAS